MHPSVIFGPVASSRLGRSLGLDLLGSKTCSFDCLYCEVGPTTLKTLERSDYVPMDQLLEELAAWKKNHPGLTLDYVTLGGMGEPTLNTALAGVIQGARALFPGVPVAVLTNSSLMSDPLVRRELALADAVLPSMDALDPAAYRKVNRPHRDLDLEAIAQGLLDFRADYAGQLYLEVLLVEGLNDTAGNLELLREYVGRLRPDRVDVVTMTRPGAWEGARQVDAETLRAWRAALGAQTTVKAPGRAGGGEDTCGLEDSVRESLLRRGQTAGQLALALGVEEGKIREILAYLLKHGHIREEGTEDGKKSGEIFYKSVRKE